jgi:Arc/MetJ family transcription regulator
MPPPAEQWVATGSLRGVADSTTSAVVALLLLIAVAVLGFGLIRAIVMNRRPQIIMADMAAPAGNTELAEAATLSSVVRQYVQRQINDQRAQITRIGKDILAPASRELELQLDSAAVDQMVRRAARDSIGTLLAALRAVAPDSADRFLGLFTVILPPPRGVSVGVALLQRGAGPLRRVGVSVEIVGLDGRAVASEIFWEPLPALPDAPAAQPGSTERILSLLEPVTRWIAVRLVLALMVSPRHRITRPTRQGLRRLLVGGLFLQAMRDFPDQALTFSEQACLELEQARQLLPQSPLPITTLAGVYERMGWARQKVGAPGRASDDFRAAAALWEEAEKVTREGDDTSEAKLAILLDRRLKAQLESDDLTLWRAALTELSSITAPSILLTNRVWLYNRGCLFAQASKADSGADHQKHALFWLGLGLRLYSDSSMWDYAAQRDPELEPIRSALGPFLTHLRNLIPNDPSQLNQVAAEALVTRAINHTTR